MLGPDVALRRYASQWGAMLVIALQLTGCAYAQAMTGYAAQMVGLPQLAAVVYQYSLERDPKNARVMYNLAYALMVEQRYTEAEHQMEKLLEFQPDRSDPYGLLAQIQQQQNQQGKILGTFMRCVEKVSNVAEQAVCRSALAAQHAKLGAFKAAEQELAVAIKQNEASSLVNYNAAITYAYGGDKRRSLDSLRYAMQMEPRFISGFEEDPDFAPWRNDSQYQALIEEIRKNRP